MSKSTKFTKMTTAKIVKLANSYKKGTMSLEYYTANQHKYFTTHSIQVAKRYQHDFKAGRIYRLVNGIFVIKKAKPHEQYRYFHEVKVS